MPELQPLTCILDLRYARRPKAIDPFYGPDDVELCLDVLGPDPLPSRPTATVLRIDGCPGWGPGWRNAGIGPSSNPMLARAGFMTVSVSVRHSRQARFPAQLHDTHAAIEWLRGDPFDLPIDGDRIGIWGQSAGGHLAALAALTGNGIAAAVSISGPSDFLGAGWPKPENSVITELFGGDVRTRMEQMRDASPVSHVNAAAPPLLIIHGTLDETVPFTQAERLHQAIQESGGRSRLVPVAGGYHNLRSDPRPAGGVPMPPEVGETVLAFFEEHLRAG